MSVAFGRVLREQRLARGVSQEALALEAGVDRTFVSQLERGIRQPTLTTLWKLAGVLRIAPPLVITEAELDQALDALDRVLVVPTLPTSRPGGHHQLLLFVVPQ